MIPSLDLLYFLPTFAPAGGTGSLRMVKQIQHLARRGHRIRVLTRRSQRTEYVDHSLLANLPDSVRVDRRLDGIRLRDLPTAYRALRNVLEDGPADWLITTSPEDRHHLIGWGMSRLLGLSWHCDLRDPVGGGTLKAGLKHRMVGRAELITTAWPREALLPTSLAGRRTVEWIPNGYDPGDVNADTRSRDSGRPVRFVHLGSLYEPQQDPFVWLEAIDRLRKEKVADPKRCQFEFVGAVIGSDLEARVRDFLAARELEGLVTVTGFLSHQKALARLVQSDVGLIYSTQPKLPYKFVDYLGASLPVLGCLPRSSPLRELVSESEEPVRWERPGDRTRLTRTLRAMIDRPPRGEYSDRLRGRFDLRTIAARLETLYERGVG